ncbi:MAG: Na/Pi symporter [Bacteroidota bacterium]
MSFLLLQASPSVDWFTLVMGILAGLVLFLLGVDKLAHGFQILAGDRLKTWLGRFTTNRFRGLVSGTVVTAVLDSSSVTIIMLITLVHAGLITFVQALGVILGSNIGTTIGSQIIAFEIHAYAPIAMLAGFGMYLLAPSERVKAIGEVTLGFGLLFFGLGTLGGAVEPLRDYPAFLSLMEGLGDRPIIGALIGALATVVLQSSSATVGIAITMAMSGIMPLSSGIAVLLGAEVGTVANTVVATIGRSREAVRAALFHFFFNATTVILGLLLVNQLVAFAEWSAPGAGAARQIANAHVFFNVAGALLFLPLLGPAAKALLWLVPASDSEDASPEDVSIPEEEADIEEQTAP